MKIKAPNRLHLRRASQRRLGLSAYQAIDKKRVNGRLSQLNKHNHRKPSEFIKMAERIENE